MSEKQSIWSKADSFLTTTRKIIVNSLTALILVVVTFSLLGGIGSMFNSPEKIDTKIKFFGLNLSVLLSIQRFKVLEILILIALF